MFNKAKRLLGAHIRNRFLFDAKIQERLGRHELFFRAFKALSFNGIDGDYAEFGSQGCMTFAMAHRESRRHGLQPHLWAFDSFQGLPPQHSDKDAHPKWVEGQMATPLDKFHALCRKNGIARGDYTVVPGFYDQTLPALAAQGEPSRIALAYIDCDLYSSTVDVLKFLQPRLRHGMLLAFDDYFCWSAAQISGERRAMLEVFNGHSRWSLLPYVQFGWHGQSFCVEDRSLMDASA